MDFMVNEGILKIPKDCYSAYKTKSFYSNYRAVQRYLRAVGYTRGKKMKQVQMKDYILVRCNYFCRRIHQNERAPEGEKKRLCFLDKSYLNQHYHFNDVTIYYPNNDQDL